jgi:ComF family protein
MQPAWSVRRGAHGWLAEASDAIVSVFFPAGCRICDKLLTRASRVPICEECLASFEAPPEKKCELCGQTLAEMTAVKAGPFVCRACQQKTYAFDRARSFGIYDGPLVRAILLLKWERIEPLGSWFAQRLAEIAGREVELLAGDVVVPVPLHRDRERERGYNQAGLISMRTRPRPNKQVLSFEERWESVRGAFATRPGSQVDNKRVLLVDDVMTTGATLDACARALLESGAKSVIGLTVARAARNPLPAPGNGTL